jgi:pimeloyl-ACP methyl ester carboxylesterase
MVATAAGCTGYATSRRFPTLVAPAGHGGRKPPRAPLVKWKGLDSAEREAALRHNLVTLMLHPSNLDAQAISIYEAQCHAAPFRVKHIVRNGGLRHALERSAVPLLLVWGEHDVTAIPHELGPQMVAGLGAPAEWRVIEGAGHWVQYERPAVLSELLTGWFGEASAHKPARARRPGNLPISRTSKAGRPGSDFIP